jgi:RHS repeat-associated protein
VLLARYAFDPWGRRALSTGTDLSGKGFTGHNWQAAAGLWLTQYRAYSPELARWLSEDPAGFEDGPNLYGYVANQPTQAIDPFGLQLYVPGPPPVQLPPLQCYGGPWRFVTHGLIGQLDERKWRRIQDTVIPVASGSGANRKDSLFLACMCNWIQAGVQRVTKTFGEWSRDLTCCGKTEVQYARTYRQTSRDLPTIDNGTTQRFRASGIMGGNGSCLCRATPPK